MLEKVISGAQVGADTAGLVAAHRLGIPTGGYVTRGRRTLFGNISDEDMNKYCLIETDKIGYAWRTEMNVRESDGTIRFAYNFRTSGEKCTLKAIIKYKKPFFDIPLSIYDGVVSTPYAVEDLMNSAVDRLKNVKTLNVAGNGNQAIEDYVANFCANLFMRLR